MIAAAQTKGCRRGKSGLHRAGCRITSGGGVTAYDTQKLRSFYAYFGGDEALLHKSSIIGALQLYLDYINIFLYVIRLLGRSRSN